MKRILLALAALLWLKPAIAEFSGPGPISAISLGSVLDVSTQGSVSAAIATGKNLYFPAGSWTLTGAYVTVPTTQTLWFAPGASLSCSSNLAIRGPIVAARTQIFASGCLPSLYSNIKLPEAYPEWWGAAADSSGAAGNGADNRTAFQNAIASGASVVSLASGSYRMSPGVTSARSNFALKGASRDISKIFIDDPVGTTDGFYFSNGSGNILIQDIGLFRIQSAVGNCGWAYPYAPGTGYAPGDTVTISGGTFTSACVLSISTTGVVSAFVASGGSGGTNGTQTVTGTTGTGTPFQASVTVTGGAIAAVLSISVAGSYTVNPTALTNEPVTGAGLTGASLSLAMGAMSTTVTSGGAYTAAPVGNAPQSATSGGGTGATFWLTMNGPADLHIEDSYRVQINHNSFGAVATTWNAITIGSNVANPNKIYIDANQFNGAENDNIFVYGTPTEQTAVIFVQNHNYLLSAGRAAIELFQNVSGIFVDNNDMYNDNFAVIANAGAMASGSVNVVKIRANDEDTNTSGSYWRGVAASQYQNNWHSSGGRWVCELCSDILATANHFVGVASGVTLLGSTGIGLDDNQYSGMSNAVTLGLSGSTNTQYISAVGSVYIFGGGSFLNDVSGIASRLTFSVQTDSAATLTSGSLSYVTNLGSDPTNVNNSPTSATLGQHNQITQSDSEAVGYGNIVQGYTGFSAGQYNTIYSGTTVSARGAYADNNGVNGADCWSSWRFAVTGDQTTCRTILGAVTTSTSATELTVAQAAASAATIVAMPNASSYSLSAKLTGQDNSGTGVGAVECLLTHALVTRGASASTTAIASGSGTFSCGGSTGTGVGIATPLLYADTTNGGFSCQVTPPNTHSWHWSCDVNYERVQ